MTWLMQRSHCAFAAGNPGRFSTQSYRAMALIFTSTAPFLFDAQRDQSHTLNVETIPWPRLLGEVRALTLKFNLVAGEDDLVLQIGQARTINNVLLKLYKLLCDKCSISKLEVELSLASQMTESDRRSILSPIYRIAALVNNSSFAFTGASPDLTTEAQAVTAHFRHLLLLKDEARLAIKIAGLLWDRPGRDLRSYDCIVGGSSGTPYFFLPKSQVIKDFVARIGKEIEAIANTNTDCMSLDLAMAVWRLKKLRDARVSEEARKDDGDVHAAIG